MSVALECRTARCRRTRVRSGAQTLQKSSTVLILLQKGQISYWNILIGTPCNKPALAIDDMGFCAQKASACAQMRASALVTPLADRTQQRTGIRNSAPAGVLVVDRRASGMTTVDAAPAATSGDAVIAARRVPPKRDHHIFRLGPAFRQNKKKERAALCRGMQGLAGWLAG